MIIVIVFFIVLFSGGVALTWWARWLGGRYGAPAFLKTLGLAFLGIPIMIIAVDCYAIYAMRMVVSGDDIDPANRSRLLAEGIAELMNGTALAAPLYLLCVLVMLGFTWRYHWSASAPKKPTGDPPYR